MTYGLDIRICLRWAVIEAEPWAMIHLGGFSQELRSGPYTLLSLKILHLQILYLPLTPSRNSVVRIPQPSLN